MPASDDALTEDGDVSVRASSSLHSMSYVAGVICSKPVGPDWVRDSSLYKGLPLSEPLTVRAMDFRY